MNLLATKPYYNIPFVFTLHSLFSYHSVGGIQLNNLYCYYINKYVDHYITVSNAVRESLILAT